MKPALRPHPRRRDQKELLLASSRERLCPNGPVPLKGLVAVATGASSGIGRAVAAALATTGASVFLVGRSAERLRSTAQALKTAPQKPRICRADLRLKSATENLRDTVAREAGRLDILIVSTGIYGRGHIEEPAAELDRLYASNVRAPFFLVQTLLPLLRSSRGQIVFVNSSSGLRAPAAAGQFSMTQHALRAMADALREELNPSGIRVLNVFPGRTATARMESLYAADGKPYTPEVLLQPDDIATMILHSLCLPRTAEVTEIHVRPMLKSYS